MLPPDLDLTFVLAGGRAAIGQLHAQPSLLGDAEGFG